MQYVIENPTLGYGLDFIRCMYRRFGARAVCFYTNKNTLSLSRRLHPELFSSDYIAAHYCVTPGALPKFIEHLRRHHTILAVVPHHEIFVLNSITIAESLGLDWVQPVVMRRFRDKFALKAHLRATDPKLRINHAELVSSPRQVLEIVQRNRLPRFVLKPNGGLGNIGIGIFTADDPIALIERYWQRTGAVTVLLEEFIDGPEYHCNGQVDAEGNITVINVCRTHSIETDSGEIVRLRDDQVLFNSPEFSRIADYIRQMIVASGLRRSPFHAELRIDESGPCLIECGARLVGSDWVRFIHMMHGSNFDMVDLAAHYYGSAKSYGSIDLDWRHHDAAMLIKIRGISTKVEKIKQLEGVREVEILAQFLQWVDAPSVGKHITVTNSLASSPYVLMARCFNLEEADEVERNVRQLVRWNTRLLSLREQGAYYAARIPGFIRWKFKLNHGSGRRLLDKIF